MTPTGPGQGRRFLRGAFPSPRHKAFAACPHVAAPGVPGSFGVVPARLSVWGNDTYGDCVSAEEAAAKVMSALMAGVPEIFVTEPDLVHWARSHGFLNGASITAVMDAMARDGLPAGGRTYTDGPYHSVDWTDDATLSSAIYQGPVKLGVSSDQLEAAGAGTANGWVGTGFRAGHDVDHCVNLCGFGTAAELCATLGVPVPAALDAAARCYLLFTWGTVGVIDRASVLAITGEAWLRTPTTPGLPAPAPAPTPPPVPPPTSGATGAVVVNFDHMFVATSNPGQSVTFGGSGAVTLDPATGRITAPAGWSTFPFSPAAAARLPGRPHD